jgi:hypothetical protein
LLLLYPLGMSNYAIGQTVDHMGRRGTITATTADADTGEQLTIIVRFVWSDKGFEFKADDRWLSIPEILPAWMSREGDTLTISDKD